MRVAASASAIGIISTWSHASPAERVPVAISTRDERNSFGALWLKQGTSGPVHGDRQGEKNSKQQCSYGQVEISSGGAAECQPGGQRHPREGEDDCSIDSGREFVAGYRVVTRSVVVFGSFLDPRLRRRLVVFACEIVSGKLTSCSHETLYERSGSRSWSLFNA